MEVCCDICVARPRAECEREPSLDGCVAFMTLWKGLGEIASLIYSVALGASHINSPSHTHTKTYWSFHARRALHAVIHIRSCDAKCFCLCQCLGLYLNKNQDHKYNILVIYNASSSICNNRIDFCWRRDLGDVYGLVDKVFWIETVILQTVWELFFWMFSEYSEASSNIWKTLDKYPAEIFQTKKTLHEQSNNIFVLTFWEHY